MKTAEQKARHWICHNSTSRNLIIDEQELQSLVDLLKEQDRDTRKACADAVLAADLENTPINEFREKLRRTCDGSVDKVKYFMAFESYDVDGVLRSKGCLIAEHDLNNDIEILIKDSKEKYRVENNIKKEENITTIAFNRI